MTLTHKSFEKYGLVSLGTGPQKKPPRGRFALAILAVIIIAAWYWAKVYDNFHVIVENEAYRSGQVSARELGHYIDKFGLKSVVNLRANTQATWWARERALCDSSGVTHIDVPLHGREAITPEKIEQLLAAMEAAPKPVLIHCRFGADRAGLASALYLRHITGESEDDAAKALSAAYGHLPFLIFPVRKYDAAYRDFNAGP